MLACMSCDFPNPTPRDAGPLRVGLVASRFNEHFTDALLRHCVDELAVLAPDAAVRIWRPPGAFEIPLLVQMAAASCDVVVALGVLREGGTLHADLIARTATQALMDISLRCGIPVIHQILVVQNEKQAVERCLELPHNRGTEAARAAVAAVKVIREGF